MIQAAEILHVLGQRSPSRPSAAEQTARSLVRKGLPASVIDALAGHFGANVEDVLHAVGLSKATGARKRASTGLLRPASSDRAFRMAAVLVLARHVLEDDETAQQWFREPNRALQGERPLDLLDTEIGTQQVVRVLNRLEGGVYS